MSIRPVKSTSPARATLEGAGVHLHRAFGFDDPAMLDPFLLFDDFGSDRPEDYRAGFPWHPHRGIETITYVLDGEVEHQDSLGNTGVLRAGDVQWMTAGSGIMHQEMPGASPSGKMHGFQLWANLPSALKMTTPHYQDIPGSEIAERFDDDGTRIRIIVGAYRGIQGPVEGVAAEPQYLDITLPAGVSKTFPMDSTRNSFAYIFEGRGQFANASAPTGVLLERQINGQEVTARDHSGARTLVQFDSGDSIAVQAGPEGMRFLLISGAPLREPIAWHGPIVMNTRQELVQAFDELRNGDFIKDR